MEKRNNFQVPITYGLEVRGGMWHLTCDTWHLTYDMCHVTDTGYGKLVFKIVADKLFQFLESIV